jgi:hypothetical protein
LNTDANTQGTDLGTSGQGQLGADDQRDAGGQLDANGRLNAGGQVQQSIRGGNANINNRYRRHNGEWWYWTPAGSWVYHRDGRWNPYVANSFVRPGYNGGRYGSGYRDNRNNYDRNGVSVRSGANGGINVDVNGLQGTRGTTNGATNETSRDSRDSIREIRDSRDATRDSIRDTRDAARDTIEGTRETDDAIRGATDGTGADGDGGSADGEGTGGSQP